MIFHFRKRQIKVSYENMTKRIKWKKKKKELCFCERETKLDSEEQDELGYFNDL